MGRHVEASGTPLDLRRTVRIVGVTGGLAWVLPLFLPGGGSLEKTLLRVGAVLITVALLGLGLLLVRGDVPALRLFVGVALPVLVWGVFGIVHQSVSDAGLVDAVFGAVVGLACALGIGRQGSRAPRATL